MEEMEMEMEMETEMELNNEKFSALRFAQKGNLDLEVIERVIVIEIVIVRSG